MRIKRFIQSKFKHLLIAGFFSLLINTCISQKKIKTLTGRWVGTYGNNEKNEPYYFSFSFNEDSTVTTYTAYNKIYGHGKYKLVKDTLSLTYRVDNDVQQYECTGIYNDSTRMLSGTWRRISDVGTRYKYTQKGKWIMKPER